MSIEHIPGGGFTVARQIFQSNVWVKDPMYLKIWIWIIGKANHSSHKKNGQQYKRGEVVTTYETLIKAGMYVHNRRRIFPTLKKIRVILNWLEKEGMIRVEPLKSGLGRTGADTGASTRAYIGIRIIIINYDSYQDLESYKGRDKGRDISEQGHNNNNEYNNNDTPGKISEKISTLKTRYPNPDLIESAIAALASTRKRNRIADSVILAQLEKWDAYPAPQVETAIRTYLEKNYAGQGKREQYLLGIIKNGNRQKSAPAVPDWY